MASPLTTAMLALPNNSNNEGVVWCFPLEDGAGSISTTDVSTNSNADLSIANGSITHGTTINLGSANGGAQATPGQAAIVPGAAYSWGNPTTSASIGNGVVLNNTVNSTDFINLLGSTWSTFAVINMPTASARTDSGCSLSGTLITDSTITTTNTYVGMLVSGAGISSNTTVASVSAGSCTVSSSMTAGSNINVTFCYSGSIFGMPGLRASFYNGGRITAYYDHAYGGGSGSYSFVGSNEIIPPGVHTIEFTSDGTLLQLKIDGQLQGSTIIGLSSTGQVPAIAASTTIFAIMGTGLAAPSSGFTMNNFLILNRQLDSDEHHKFASLVNSVGYQKFPFKNRMKDAYVSAVAANGTLSARGCAGCGGQMASNEAKLSVGSGRQYHPGCYNAHTLSAPFSSTSTYSEAAINISRTLLSALESLLGGPTQYHDGTRFYAGADGEDDSPGSTSLATSFERELLTATPFHAYLAEYLRVPHDHWLWQIVRSGIERGLTFQIGTPAIKDGLTSNADNSANTSGLAGGALAISIQVNGVTVTDDSFTTFSGGGLMMGMASMAPYISKQEPDTWSRWLTGATTMGTFMWEGYFAGVPYFWQYTPNGNWCLNQAYAMYGVWKVTGDEIWYTRFQTLLEYAVCPLSANLQQGTVVAAPIPSNIPKNALGNYNPRGMWSPNVAYAYGDQVGIPYYNGGLTGWVGRWVSGNSYTVGQMVQDMTIASPSTTTMFYVCSATTSGTTVPSQDTAHWTAYSVGNFAIYLCNNPNGMNSTTSPNSDSANWHLALTSQSWQRNGFYGIQGVSGTDTENWSDYTAWFAESVSNGGLVASSNGPPGTEMQGLPGYDGDYTQLDLSIITEIFIGMGGMNGPTNPYEQTEWQQIKRYLNALTNQQLPHVTVSSSAWTENNTQTEAGGYGTRHSLVDSWRNNVVLSLIENGGRSDIANNYPSITPYNYANGNITGLIENGVVNVGNQTITLMMQLAQFLALDPNGPPT
jgi:hypothetical protein